MCCCLVHFSRRAHTFVRTITCRWGPADRAGLCPASQFMRCRLQSVSWSGLGIPARASGVRRKTCACAIVNVPSIARPAFKLPFGVPHSKWREQYDGARLGFTQQANASPYRADSSADSSAYSCANASTRWYQAVPDTSRRRRPRRRYVALLAKPAAIAEHKHALHTHFCAGTAHICAGTELRTPRPRQANCALMPISATISAPGPPTRAEASSQHRGRGTATVACRGGHHGEEWVDLCTAVNTVWSYGPDGTDLGDVLKPSSDVRIPGTPLALLRRALPKGPHDVMRKCHISKGHISGL